MGSVLTTPEGIFAQPLQRQKPVALRMIGCVATPGNPVCALSHTSGPGQKQCRATRTPEAPVCDVTLIRDQARCRRVFCVTRVTGRTCPVVIEKLQRIYSFHNMASSEIAQCLTATLSSDTNTRISAELKLSEILRAPGSLLSRPHCGRRRLMSRRVLQKPG